MAGGRHAPLGSSGGAAKEWRSQGHSGAARLAVLQGRSAGSPAGPRRARPARPRGEVLGGSSLELRRALRLVAALTREVTKSDFCSIFLVDSGQLHPVIVVRGDAWPAPYEPRRFFGSLAVDPDLARRFASGGAVAIEDACADLRFPTELALELGLRSVAVALVRHGDQAAGIIAVGRDEVRPFAKEDVRLLESMSVHAAEALADAQPIEGVRRRARVQEALARGVAALSAPVDTDEIASRLVSAFAEIVPSGVTAIALVDAERSELGVTALTAAKEVIRREAVLIEDIPPRLLAHVRATWATVEPTALEIDSDPWVDALLGAEGVAISRYLILPLFAGERISGAVSLGFLGGIELDAEERDAVTSLAAIGGAVLERQALLVRLGRQVRQLEALYHLDSALAVGADAGALVAGLNSVLCDHAASVVGLEFTDRTLARRFGRSGRVPPVGPDRSDWVRGDDGSWAVPMHLGRRRVGSLCVEMGAPDPDRRAFLEALAGGLAEAANRAALRSAVEEGARERAVVSERERFAADLHDSAGQLFVAISLMGGRLSDRLPPESEGSTQAARLAQLADEGKRAIEDAVRAIRFLPVSRRGIVPSLKSLARSVASDSGLSVSVEVKGRPVRLGTALERALFRVGHEALANAWRHARCRVVLMTIEFSSGDVRLVVCDDGVGLKATDGEHRLHTGIANMRRAMDEVSGSLRVRDSRKGVTVEARIARTRA